MLIAGLAYALLGSHAVDIFLANPAGFLDAYSAPLVLSLLSTAVALPFWLIAWALNRVGPTGTLGFRCSVGALLLLDLLVFLQVRLAPVVRESGNVVLANFLVLALATASLIRLRQRTAVLARIGIVYLASVVGVNALDFGLHIVDAADESANPYHEFADTAVASADRPHVFHVLFDGMSGLALLGKGEFAEDAFYRNAPSGIYYRNTFAQADQTKTSLPHFLRGGFEYNEHLSVESLGETFLREGYQVKLYTDLPGFGCVGNNRGTDLTHEMPFSECYDKKWLVQNVPAVSGREGTTTFQARRLFNAYLMRIGREDLSETVSRVFDPDETATGRAPHERPRKGPSGAANTTLALVDKFLADLDQLDRPTYHFVHLPIPHLPAIFDRDCNVIDDTTSIMRGDMVAAQDRVHGHMICSNKIAGRIIARLQELDLYDSSFIIMNSDHGLHAPKGGYRSMPVGRLKKKSRLPEGKEQRGFDFGFEARARAVLWLKPPHFQISETRTHLAFLLDIPATLRAALDLPSPRQDGLDLLAFEPEVYDSRTLYYFGSNWNKQFFFAKRSSEGRWSVVEPEEAIEKAGKQFR